mmetsp:Transcript_96458/g.275050  ORF Transcript_96458/g.275050 Transcript_96458/m.275050 type:complete len:770 (+) Transcript_96458:2594-4903(+)
MKVLEDLNMAIRYEAFFNLVLGFYLLLMFAFLVIHVFPNLFPAGGFVKNWSYIWFEFSFDIFVMTAYGIITRGLGCTANGHLVANQAYLCGGTFFRRYLAFTSFVMALILLCVLSFSSFFVNQKRRNPRYLPRSKFIVSLCKFMVSLINALPLPGTLRWSMVFVCLCFLLLQQVNLQPVVGNARWINNTRTGVYAVALSASCFAGVHMFSEREYYQAVVLAFVIGSPLVFGVAVYFNDRLAQPLGRKDLIDAVVERRLRGRDGKYTEAMVVAFHSCPDVIQVVNEAMVAAEIEQGELLSAEDDNGVSSFAVTGQRERMDSQSTHFSFQGISLVRSISSKMIVKLGRSSRNLLASDSQGTSVLAQGNEKPDFPAAASTGETGEPRTGFASPLKAKVAPMLEGQPENTMTGKNTLEPLAPTLKITVAGASSATTPPKSSHEPIGAGKSVAETLTEMHGGGGANGSNGSNDDSSSTIKPTVSFGSMPKLDRRDTNRGDAFHMNVSMAKSQAVTPDVAAALEMLAVLAEERHGRETMRDKAPYSIKFLLKLVHVFPQHIVPILYSFSERDEGCRELIKRSGGFQKILRCIRESAEFWSPLSANRLNVKVAQLAKSNTEKNLLGGAATNSPSSLPISSHFPRRGDLRRTVGRGPTLPNPHNNNRPPIRDANTTNGPQRSPHQMIQKKKTAKNRRSFGSGNDDQSESIKDIFTSSRTTKVMGKDNARLLRSLHALANDMTEPENYLVHWIDYLPFVGPHEIAEKKQKVGSRVHFV